jgi:hypothetical protein
MYLFHHHLAVLRTGPAQALRLAQLWMVDPLRRLPPGLPTALRALAAASDGPDLASWAGFSHLGQW